jgi:hypothetical protein
MMFNVHPLPFYRVSAPRTLAPACMLAPPSPAHCPLLALSPLPLSYTVALIVRLFLITIVASLSVRMRGAYASHIESHELEELMHAHAGNWRLLRGRLCEKTFLMVTFIDAREQ